jgi:hypothetical protein
VTVVIGSRASSPNKVLSAGGTRASCASTGGVSNAETIRAAAPAQALSAAAINGHPEFAFAPAILINAYARA